MKKNKRVPGKVGAWNGVASRIALGDKSGMAWSYKIDGGPLDGIWSDYSYRTKAMAIGAGRAAKLKALLDCRGDLGLLWDYAKADRWIENRILELGGQCAANELQAIYEYKAKEPSSRF